MNHSKTVMLTSGFGTTIDADEYWQLVPDLRFTLLNLQFDLRNANTPVLILIGGDDRNGCNEVFNLLNEWMDARYLESWAFEGASDEERERPLFWRYWRVFPRNGRIGIFMHAWTFHALREYLATTLIDENRFQRRLQHIQSLEKMLWDDGTRIVKIWLHLPKNEFKKRFNEARQSKVNGWKFREEDWQLFKKLNKNSDTIFQVLSLTGTEFAPWHIIESTDKRYRNVTVAQTIIDVLNRPVHAESADTGSPPAAEDSAPKKNGKSILARVDLKKSLAKKEYDSELKRWQAEVARLTHLAYDKGVSSILVFEGWDAAGKGGAIRRITSAMDATQYKIFPISAPTEEEKGYNYMWRFWKHMQRAGRLNIFDRSWYGRVLVERVEGFCSPHEWERAYDEINDFEQQICNHGSVLVKFWLHIDQDVQLRRFEERRTIPYKKYKITREDYRNRSRWDDYVLAADDMFRRTDTDIAPWTIVPANDKRYARIEVLKTFCAALRERLS